MKLTFRSQTFISDTFASLTWAGGLPKFPSDTDWNRVGVGDAAVAVKSGEIGEGDWSRAGIGSVAVAAKES